MLTARDDELDKVLGLELGADDYITKPFSIREFRSRVRALLRRAATPHFSGRRDDVIDRGDVVVDLPRRTVEVRGEPVALTFVEFELLALLASEPGVVFSRRQLLERIRGQRRLPGATHDRRPRPPSAREDRARLARPGADPHRPGRRLPLPGRRMRIRLPGGIRTTLAVALLVDRRRRARRGVPDGRAVARATARGRPPRRAPAGRNRGGGHLRKPGLQPAALDRPVRRRRVDPLQRSNGRLPGVRPLAALPQAARGLRLVRKARDGRPRRAADCPHYADRSRTGRTRRPALRAR